PAHAAVASVILARDESFFHQTIDGYTDGSRSEPDLWTDGVHGERALVQENFQDSEIGVAQFRPLDALSCVGEQRLKGFHENEPDVHAGGVLLFGGAFLFHLK